MAIVALYSLSYPRVTWSTLTSVQSSQASAMTTSRTIDLLVYTQIVNLGKGSIHYQGSQLLSEIAIKAIC